MLEQWVVPLSSLTVSATALLIATLSLRRNAKAGAITELRADLELIKGRLDDCENLKSDVMDKLADVREENINLMRKVLKLENNA